MGVRWAAAAMLRGHGAWTTTIVRGEDDTTKPPAGRGTITEADRKVSVVPWAREAPQPRKLFVLAECA
jgi:hypothetical protein